MGSPLSEPLVPAPPPAAPDGFRLGELIVLIPRRKRASPDEVAERVAATGYDRVEDLREWQHFRPRTRPWARGGVLRHAALRRRDLLLRLSDDGEHGGQRLHAVGLLTGAVEGLLAGLGTAYTPRA